MQGVVPVGVWGVRMKRAPPVDEDARQTPMDDGIRQLSLGAVRDV